VRTVSVSELRASCSAILKSVRDTRQPIRITHLGKMLAEFHPLTTGAAKKERLRTERDAREIEIINQNTDQLNADALEGLSYGASPSKPYGPKRSKKKEGRKQR
jgi:antitoxin (DNA-binding transcriptional repressor) of toxin-antitoxin stability system